MGPPRLNYEPADGRMSWGIHKNTSPPKRDSRPLPTVNRSNLEWGHSYAADVVNPDPRHSIMPPPLTGFATAPQIPPSPTEESVYSKRESHRSLTSRASTHNHGRSDEPRQLWDSRFSRDQQPSSIGHGGADLGRKPSGLSNPALRSAILSRASASVASLGHLSFQSGTTDHSLPPMPEGGLRLDFPLPPSPSTRVPTVMSSIPRASIGAGNVPGPSATKVLTPSRPSIKAFVSAPNLNKNSSSVFEYADYTHNSNYTTATATTTSGPSGGSGEHERRDTLRQTANWYDKPLWVWDGQSGPLPRIPTEQGGLGGDSWSQSQSQSQSRRSVTWDPADGVAMAL